MGRSPGWPSRETERRDRGSKDESEITVISGDALVLGKMSFPGLGFQFIARFDRRVLDTGEILSSGPNIVVLLLFFKLLRSERKQKGHFRTALSSWVK